MKAYKLVPSPKKSGYFFMFLEVPRITLVGQGGHLILGVGGPKKASRVP
jgi:hypothetical protein